MSKLYYCCSMYEPVIQDINPLILLAHPKDDILIICARDGQEIRLNKFPDHRITVASWWEPWDFATEEKLLNFDVVVILDRDRIDPIFYPRLEVVEKLLDAPYQAMPNLKV